MRLIVSLSLVMFGIRFEWLCITNEAHRLPKHEDYILIDDSARRGEEKPGDGDVEDRDGANEGVRPDETHLGVMSPEYVYV